MNRFCVAFLILLLSADNIAHAQCPDRPAIIKRVAELKTLNVPVSDQLLELTRLLPAFDRCPVKNDTVYGYLSQRIGALYSLQNDFTNAVKWSRKSIDIMRVSDSPAKPAFLVRVYNFLHMFYDSLDMPRQKWEAADSCIFIAIRTGTINDMVIFNVWEHMDHSFNVGDYQRCLQYSGIGNTIVRYCSNMADSLIYASSFFNMHVNALILMKQLDQAQAILVDQIKAYRARNEENSCGVFYNQLAEITTQRRRYDSSVLYLMRSFTCNKAIRYRLGCKQTCNNIGFLFFSRLGMPDSAMTYFKKAMTFTNDLDANKFMDAIETLNIYDNIANIWSYRGNFDSASYYYQKAFNQIRPSVDERSILDPSNNDFMSSKQIQYIVGLIKDKGDHCIRQYRHTHDQALLKNGLRIYRIADQVLTRAKSDQAEALSGLAWRANARNLYEKAIDACYLSNDAALAFYFFEKSRAILLRDELENHRHSSVDEISRQVQLKRKLAVLRESLAAAVPASAKYDSLQRDMYAAMQENDLISQEIRKRDPLYYRDHIDTSFMSVQELRKNILQEDRSLMELFYGDSSIYVLFFSHKDQALKKIDKKGYDSLTATFVQYISNPVLLNQNYERFLRSAHALYSVLFASLPLRTERLIISPDGQYFPFEALAIHGDAGHPYFLLYDHALSYTYSAGYLANETANTRGNQYFMGMAPVNFDSHLKLPGLPESDGSLHSISSFFRQPKEFINQNATRGNFLRSFSSYRILQLYTHATGGNDREEPEIFFSDSSLRLSDIEPVYASAARLVVLSACETGNGSFYTGEGVFSFNRTFASIGIPSSLVNLWSVDNQAVYQLTELFYKYLVQGLPLDVSLQRAKLEYIRASSKERSMPYYWAAAVIVGQSSPVLPPAPAVPWKLISTVLSLVLAAFLAYLCITAWTKTASEPESAATAII